MDELWKKTVGDPLRVAITAAGRKMAPPLVYLLVQGEAFGDQQRVILHLIDVENKLRILQGFARELLNSGFPLLADVVVTSHIERAFKDVDVAFILPYPRLTIARSRKEKMEERLALYKLHGEALSMYAKPEVLVLLVGHPSSLNALVCSRYAANIPDTNFAGLSRFAINLAKAAIAAKARGRADYVYNLVAWGNIGNTLYVDTSHATMRLREDEEEQSVSSAVNDDFWLKGAFLKMTQGALTDNVENTRALSVSLAAVQQMREWWLGTEPGRWANMIVISKGEYDVPPGLFFSFPVSISNKQYSVVKGLKLEQFDLSKIDAAVKELQEEWKTARKLCCTYWPFPETLEPEDEQELEEEVSGEESECVFKGLRMFPAEDCELKKRQQQQKQQQQQILKPELGEWDLELMATPKNLSRGLKIASKPSASPSQLTEQSRPSLNQRAPIMFSESHEGEPYLEAPHQTPKEPPAVPNNSPRSLKSSPKDSVKRKKKSSLRR